jgi:hypothetical protein
VLDLDRRATGEDRSRLLTVKWPGTGLIASNPEGKPVGYHLPIAEGALGAVVAEDERAGEELLAAALGARPSGRVAEPEPSDPALRLLDRLGYEVDFRVTRMYLGPKLGHHPEWMFGLFNLYWG